MDSTISEPDSSPQFHAESHDKKHVITDQRHQKILIILCGHSRSAKTRSPQMQSLAQLPRKKMHQIAQAGLMVPDLPYCSHVSCWAVSSLVTYVSIYIHCDSMTVIITETEACVATLAPAITDQFMPPLDLRWYALAY
ncbi:hypothetical protein N7448_011152 [Penicillium atrosanguineum]|nr:hypothetical protein N7448_011152 [Penicillium atrosanguineum]